VSDATGVAGDPFHAQAVVGELRERQVVRGVGDEHPVARAREQCAHQVERQRRAGGQEQALTRHGAGALAREPVRERGAGALVAGFEAVLEQVGIESGRGPCGGSLDQGGRQQVRTRIAPRQVDHALVAAVLGGDVDAHGWSIPSGAGAVNGAARVRSAPVAAAGPVSRTAAPVTGTIDRVMTR
jgi:hypothetical protein